MLNAITLILLFQICGELISRGTGLPVPGPVLGMILMLMAFFLKDNLIGVIRPTSGVLLTNLSLLFVPAGVGIIRQGERFANEGLGIFAVIVISTIISMVVTAYTIVLAQKLLHIKED
mgnify:CR=1 FL=1